MTGGWRVVGGGLWGGLRGAEAYGWGPPQLAAAGQHRTQASPGSPDAPPPKKHKTLAPIAAGTPQEARKPRYEGTSAAEEYERKAGNSSQKKLSHKPMWRDVRWK